MNYEVTELTRVEIKGAKPFILRPGHVISEELARKAGLLGEISSTPAPPKRPARATPPKVSAQVR